MQEAAACVDVVFVRADGHGQSTQLGFVQQFSHTGEQVRLPAAAFEVHHAERVVHLLAQGFIGGRLHRLRHPAGHQGAHAVANPIQNLLGLHPDAAVVFEGTIEGIAKVGHGFHQGPSRSKSKPSGSGKVMEGVLGW